MYSSEVLAAVLGLPCPTPEQQQIIESPLYPALVVAGAGSGKTETMSARVVYLVANELVHPQQILGLTFTRKAANELAERIEQRINALREIKKLGLLDKAAEIHAADGFEVLNEQVLKKQFPDAATRRHQRQLRLREIASKWGCTPVGDEDSELADLGDPEVSTYNSFADSIVRLHGIHLGLNPEAQVQSEANAWLLMREIVLESDDPRLVESAWQLNTVIERALQLAAQIDDNLVSLDQLRAFPEAFAKIQNLPSATKRSALLAFIKTDVERINALLWLADLVEIYQRRKSQLGLLDFSDQLLGAYRIISANDHLVTQMRQQYQVVLLDEYQDTSVVQTKLLSRIFAQHPVMAVGDTNQAIYTWRGASANNLSEFPNDFAPKGGCLFFTLSTSWRNDRLILKAANALISSIPDSERSAGAASTNLLPELNPRPTAQLGSVDLIWGDDVYEESEQLAQWFKSRLSAEKSAAVLFRSRSQMRFFEEAFAKAALPYQTIGRGGLLSAPEIVDIVCALKVIHDPGSGSELIRLLAGPRWQISLPDLKKLLTGATRLSRAIDTKAAESELPPENARRASIAKDPDSTVTLYDALMIFAQLSEDAKAQTTFFGALSPLAKTRLREAGEVFLRLSDASVLGLAELVDEISNELRLDIELIANEKRASAALALRNLKLFKTEVRQFASLRDDGGVSELLDWLDYLAENDSLAVSSEDAEEGVIQLMTIHAAKGLEWDLVAVPRMLQGALPNKPKSVSGWLSNGLPYLFRGDTKSLPEYRFDDPEIATQQELQSERKRFQEGERNYHLAEERRLAYVAVTRAREQLVLSGHNTSLTGTTQTVSDFLRTISEALEISIPEATPASDQERGSTAYWPRDPLGSRRDSVTAAAKLVAEQSVTPSEAPLLRENLSPELQLLLAENESNELDVVLPQRIAASSLHGFRDDYEAAMQSYLRPMPMRPYRQSRLGTLFHSWVEQRSLGQRHLDDRLFDDEFLAASTATNDELESLDESEQIRLEELKEKFLRSQWAELKPLWVEHEIQFVDTSLGNQPHIIVCKMDAVYRRGERIEIVDWKTGKGPKTESDRATKLVQLEVYREAYHRHHGVPLDQIDVVLFYLDSEEIIRA